MKSSSLWIVGLMVAGCTKPHSGEEPPGPTAPPEKPQVERLTIDDQDHWQKNEFVEMIPPARLPTNSDGSDKITVWLYVPDGKTISLKKGRDGTPKFEYPPGAISDRVEYFGAGTKDARVWMVSDVRGTRIADDGTEMFHVYRPVNAEVGAQLVGYEWPRDDAAAQKKADDDFITFATTAAQPGTGKPLGAAGLERLRDVNDCGGCHLHQKPEARTASQVGYPRRSTDAHGWYTPQTILADSALLETHRTHDPNAKDPYVTISCAGGGKPTLNETSNGRHYACSDNSVPLGTRDIAKGLAEGDDYTKRLCESRRYIFEHLSVEDRKQFAEPFRACGLGE